MKCIHGVATDKVCASCAQEKRLDERICRAEHNERIFAAHLQRLIEWTYLAKIAAPQLAQSMECDPCWRDARLAIAKYKAGVQ